MTDENNRRLQEEQDEAALGLLLEEYAEIEGAAFWREFQAAEAAREESQTQEREYRESSRGSETKDRRIDTLKRMGKCFKRVAIIFLVLVGLLSTVVVSVEAFKIPVINYIVAIKQKFSGYNFGSNDELSRKAADIVELVCSVVCPDGYYYVSHEVTPYGMIWVYFENEEKDSLIVSIYPSDGQINIDTEDVNQESMKLLDYEAVYLQKEGHRVMWMDTKRECVFSVHAYDMEEEIFWKYVYLLAGELSQ